MKKVTPMNRSRLIFMLLPLATLLFAASCAVTHQNEQYIVGKWKPTNIETIIDSAALKAATANQAQPPKESKGVKKTGTSSGEWKGPATIDRLVQTEERASLEIFPDKTAIKHYPGKDVKVTWKMRGKGTILKVKNVENKKDYIFTLLEVNKEQIIVLQNTPLGDLKITYARQDLPGQMK